jgi:hypothetical protein
MSPSSAETHSLLHDPARVCPPAGRRATYRYGAFAFTIHPDPLILYEPPIVTHLSSRISPEREYALSLISHEPLRTIPPEIHASAVMNHTPAVISHEPTSVTS